jgi:hypothetical protein
MTTGALTGPKAAAGPLVVSRANPRYFAVQIDTGGGERAVYLTGSHVWNSLQDGLGPGSDCAATPEPNDFSAYLEFLKQRGHNFVRLWRWEHIRSQLNQGKFHMCMTPQPWTRTGPGVAKDGKPKFDLTKFDPEYFGRLRDRTIAAGNEGMYVGVMLFDGFALHLTPPPDNVEGHPFHAANNINDVSIESIVDYQVLPLVPRVQELQLTYLRKVIDTVHDLPNVIYEVANESSGGGAVDQEFAKLLGMDRVPDWGDSTEWQYWVINAVKQYEKLMGYEAHPVGMTMQFPVRDQRQVNEPLFKSSAEWISPGYDDEIFADGGHPAAPGSPPSRWFADPPPNEARKIVLTDTDHYAPGQANPLWAWKSFLRGHNPILMDYGIVNVVEPLDPSLGVPSFESFEPTRWAMGDTRRYAERMQLLDMLPVSHVASTGYALVNPGEEYLILQPEASAEFTVDVKRGSYECEWFSVEERKVRRSAATTAERDQKVGFKPPFEKAGPVVLYLKKLAE